MKIVGYNKWLDMKVAWDGRQKFDVLYQRHTDEWIVVDSFVTKKRNVDSIFAQNVANTYLSQIEKEIQVA